MTCIVAVRNKETNNVLIGGDSAGVGWNHSLTVRSDEKVFTVGPFIMGFTGSFRMGQLLRFTLKVPEQKEEQSDYEYMVTTFIDAVRECLSKGGWLTKKDDVEQIGQFLVGYKGTIYDVQSDLQVGIPSHPYSAVGCGEALALGALFVAHAALNNEEVFDYTKWVKSAAFQTRPPTSDDRAFGRAATVDNLVVVQLTVRTSHA